MDKSLPRGVPLSSLDSRAHQLLQACLTDLGLTAILKSLLAIGELYLVGGAVRDALLGVAPRDLDFATSADATDVLEALTASGLRVIPTGITHGTVTVVHEGHSVEITTFRSPSHRYQSQRGATILEDLAGRDFTINALACYISLPRLDLELIDPFNGFKDIKDRALRAVPPPLERFREDPLRMLRMIRFGPAAGFTIESELEQAALECAPSLAGVSPERLRDELTGILLSPHAGNGLKMMVRLNLLGSVVPELLPTVGCEQNEFHVEDVFLHTCTVVDRTPLHALSLRLSALFHDSGKPATASVDAEGRRHFYLHELVSEELATTAMTRLKYPRKLVKQVTRLVRLHMRPITCGPSGLRRLQRDLEDDFGLWRDLKRADKTPLLSEDEFLTEMGRFDDLCAVEDARKKAQAGPGLVIDGNDVIALGVKPGPKVGEVLQYLEEVVINNPEMNTRETLIALGQTFLSR